MSEFNDALLVVPTLVIVFPLLVIAKTLSSLSFLHLPFAFSLHRGSGLAVRVCVTTIWGLKIGFACFLIAEK